MVANLHAVANCTADGFLGDMHRVANTEANGVNAPAEVLMKCITQTLLTPMLNDAANKANTFIPVVPFELP